MPLDLTRVDMRRPQYPPPHDHSAQRTELPPLPRSRTPGARVVEDEAAVVAVEVAATATTVPRLDLLPSCDPFLCQRHVAQHSFPQIPAASIVPIGCSSENLVAERSENAQAGMVISTESTTWVIKSSSLTMSRLPPDFRLMRRTSVRSLNQRT